jgi:RNA polymerase sigma-70 factor (ECF subfamily)
MTASAPPSARLSAVGDRSESGPEVADEVLMARICDGDNEALACLFRRYARRVRAVAFRVLRDASEADDLLQDVFLLIHRKCKDFDSSKSPVRFWILQMTHHRAISRRRYLGFRQFYTRGDLDDALNELPGKYSIGQYEIPTDGVLGRAGLQKLFGALSENQRQTLRLYFFQGYSFDEIAAELGQSRENVRHHYFRGLDRLRKQIFCGKARTDSVPR